MIASKFHPQHGTTLAVLVALVLLPAFGCGRSGPARTAVSGRVTLDGAPLPSGRIVFVPADNEPAAAADIVAGAFTLDAQTGPGEGRYKVMIFGNQTPPVSMDDPEAFAKSDVRLRAPVDPVAAEFNVATKLEAQVRAQGENSFQFAVTSTPKLTAQGR